MPDFQINTKWCKGCGICVALCPKQVLALKDEKVAVANKEACIACKICENHCPDFAIFVERGEKK